MSFYELNNVIEQSWTARDFYTCYSHCLLILWSGMLTEQQQSYYRSLADYCKDKE